MSESETKAITEQNIVVTIDDCHNLKNYGEYFGVALSDNLQEALNSFTEDQSFVNQQHILREFCVWITTHQHETFKDPLWEKPKSKADEFLPSLLLDHEMDKVIGGETVAETEEKPEESDS